MKNYKDKLEIVNSKRICPQCMDNKEKRKNCEFCYGSGFEPIDISGLWESKIDNNGSSGFLVCGGPSINELPFEKLNERGIVSLGVNNISAHVPVSAWCFSDPHEKFHHSLFLDPSIITFAPSPKLKRKIRIKKDNGEFENTKIQIRDCPNTFGFHRKTNLFPDKFLETNYAHWGYGGKMPDSEKPYTCLCTMLIGIRLMCYLGCQRIYMLGVDFLRSQDKQYAFDQKAAVKNGRYSHENDMLKRIKPYLESKNIKIFNCNPKSNCDAFDYVSFHDAFENCKNRVPDKIDLSEWYDKDKIKK